MLRLRRAFIALRLCRLSIITLLHRLIGSLRRTRHIASRSGARLVSLLVRTTPIVGTTCVWAAAMVILLGLCGWHRHLAIHPNV